jgi:hypothetical protein
MVFILRDDLIIILQYIIYDLHIFYVMPWKRIRSGRETNTLDETSAYQSSLCIIKYKILKIVGEKRVKNTFE